MSNSLADYKKCVIIQNSRGRLSIDCKLGLWRVSGKCHTSVERQAQGNFKQHKLAGGYDSILA